MHISAQYLLLCRSLLLKMKKLKKQSTFKQRFSSKALLSFYFLFSFSFETKQKSCKKPLRVKTLCPQLLITGDLERCLKLNKLVRSEHFPARLSQSSTERITMCCSTVALLFCFYLNCVINSIHPLTQHKALL